MSRNTRDGIIVIAITFGVVLLYASYSMHKSHEVVVYYAVRSSVRYHYNNFIQNNEKDSLGRESIVSPDELIIYFQNIPEMPPFVKLDDIMIPLDLVKLPSDEIFFAFCIRGNEEEICAVTGAGEIKMIIPDEMPKYQSP